MKVFSRLGKRTVEFFAFFVVYHIVFSRFFPTDTDGYLVAPDWYVYIGFALAIIFSQRDNIKIALRKQPDHTKTAFQKQTTESVCTVKTEPLKERFKEENNSLSNKLLSIESVDFMDGHEFEYWCADLLRKNGFANVTVTRGSGDQGVDVLAEKDGIKYAIQCKCYTRDLGNTPVQEVNAGRTIYQCHVGAVMTNRYFTKSAKEAAAATRVLLWDRDWLISHLGNTQDTTISYTTQSSERDPLIYAAMDYVLQLDSVNISMIQRHFELGYARAARILDELEELGYIGPYQGSKPRKVLK